MPDLRNARFLKSVDHPDYRTRAQRDRDRVLYCSALQRLAEVTQVLGPDEGRVFHNRLTHSLKVAQVARRLAEKAIRDQSGLIDCVGGIDPDVAEAAALAHDLGHPPFGHIAEQELNRLMLSAGEQQGYEGNAQSFRIIVSLARRSPDAPGLNLTRATLNATLKYPWLRDGGDRVQKKWGAYDTERDVFLWAREALTNAGTTRSAEAELMDWADDITYAVHDLIDFFCAGLIPLERLSSLHDGSERALFVSWLYRPGGRGHKQPISKYPRPDVERAFEKLVTTALGFSERFRGSCEQRGKLRLQTGILLSRFVDALQLEAPTEPSSRRVRIAEGAELDVALLKELTWHYVILNPGLTTQQHGQRRIIAGLFHMLRRAAKRGDLDVFPFAIREEFDRGTVSPARIICDYIAGMTERQAIRLFGKMTGSVPGSALDA